MQVFKFGGASLKTPIAVKNMFEIVNSNLEGGLVVIVSAMGKTTNTLEEILYQKLHGMQFHHTLGVLEEYHKDICSELFAGPDDPAYAGVTELLEELGSTLNDIHEGDDYDESYDRIVPYGELLSSRIVSEYFRKRKIKIQLLDARKIIITDHTFRDGKIQWDETARRIEIATNTDNDNKDHTLFLSQGFIGACEDGRTTTLGREGSDFTAAVFASILKAERVTFWKDVPGIMNADPRIIPDAILLDHLPYQEAAEMTYYGAKVIHPKTIRPLALHKIPLYVKDFDQPHQGGTCIREYDSWKRIPVIIYKSDQCLVSCKFTDFSFVNEESLVRIFDELHNLDIRVNMMQNSAISFSVCLDHNQKKTDELVNRLSRDFDIHYNTGLKLITIKNYTAQALEDYRPRENIFLEQQTRANYQAVIKD